jgi:hypothetical protein
MPWAKSYLGLFGISAISTLGWRQTMPNDSGPERLRLLPSRGHSVYSGIRHSEAGRAGRHRDESLSFSESGLSVPPAPKAPGALSDLAGS